MKLTLSLVALATLSQAATNPQLYFSPSSSSSHSSSASSTPLSLTPHQANAALAHLLSVSHHVQLPLQSGKKGANDWRRVLEEDVDATAPKVVLAIECPASDAACRDVLPTSLTSTPIHYSLPSLPLTSYLSLLTLHLHRFADSFGIAPTAIEGLQQVVEEGIKKVAGWQGWVGQELGDLMGWEMVEKKFRTAVEPKLPSTGLFDDLSLLDASALTLVAELERLTVLADSFSRNGQNDNGAQGGAPQVVIMHLKGMKEIAAKHSLSSPVYQRASALLRSTLEAFTASITTTTTAASTPARFLVLALPPHPTPLLRRKTAWLKPFEYAGEKYRRSLSSTSAGIDATNGNSHVKRSVFASQAGRKRQSTSLAPEEGGDPRNAPIVPTSHRCFASFSDANNQTASCLGRGTPVKGLTTRLKEGEECWVCKCTKTVGENGKVSRWAGEGCEKEDLSSPVALLLFSSLFLIILLGGSVLLLSNIGSVALPGTLASVGGGGGHAKRD